ncbi:MAG TPA: hypothetical protein VHB77_14520 [Planctomycetaceae bacterium]|nr:hypothetical protein [Planctomycetaceae bacterium]
MLRKPQPQRLTWAIILCPIVLIAMPGCRGARPVTGGTTGTLTIGGKSYSDVQVTFHDADNALVGFGVTDNNGNFELVTEGARGPLWLPEGEYSVTLQSAGAPLQFPAEYASPDTTPLKISWDGDPSADVELKISSVPTT